MSTGFFSTQMDFIHPQYVCGKCSPLLVGEERETRVKPALNGDTLVCTLFQSNQVPYLLSKSVWHTTRWHRKLSRRGNSMKGQAIVFGRIVLLFRIGTVAHVVAFYSRREASGSFAEVTGVLFG